MAETVTEKDVQRARSKVDRLREQIADEEAKAATTVADSNNAVRVATLETEAERLQNQLDRLRAGNRAKEVRGNVEGVIESVTDTGEGSPADIVPAPAVAEAEGGK